MRGSGAFGTRKRGARWCGRRSGWTTWSRLTRRDGGTLPDLVVIWEAEGSVTASSGVISERFGTIRWPPGRRLASGRSGNHTAHGWFVVAGPGIAAESSIGVYDTADLIRTAFRWLGATLPQWNQPPRSPPDWGAESGEHPHGGSLR